MNPEKRIQKLCAMIAVESDPEEPHSLLRQLEFALTENGLDVQNRAVSVLILLRLRIARQFSGLEF